MQLLFYGSGVMFSLSYVLQRLHLALAPGVTIRPAGAAGTPHDIWITWLVLSNPIMQIIEDLRHALVTPQAPWTEMIASGHQAALHQYASVNVPWLVPVPFLVVALVVTIGALTFRARARNFAENL